MRIGAVASEPINRDEVYISVPVKSVMSARSALACDRLSGVTQFIQANAPRMEKDFYLLLVHLMYVAPLPTFYLTLCIIYICVDI